MDGSKVEVWWLWYSDDGGKGAVKMKQWWWTVSDGCGTGSILKGARDL
jgi:hypothetical protein